MQKLWVLSPVPDKKERGKKTPKDAKNERETNNFAGERVRNSLRQRNDSVLNSVMNFT